MTATLLGVVLKRVLRYARVAIVRGSTGLLEIVVEEECIFGKPASLYLISFVSIFVMLVQLHWHWYTGKIIMHA